MRIHTLIPNYFIKSAFSPDLTAEEMQEAVDSIYDHKAPRLASMKAWPQEWLDDQDKMGWLEWYKNYSQGRRSDTDERQIKRWNSFKARHGAQFAKNPTPRRAYALRNWAIDPLELLPEEQKLPFLQLMEEYKAKEYKKWNKKKAKEADMEKAASKWTRLAEQGKLSGYSLARILRASGYSLPPSVGGLRFNRNTLKANKQPTSSGQRLAEFRQSLPSNEGGVLRTKIRPYEPMLAIPSLRYGFNTADKGFIKATNPQGLLPGDILPMGSRDVAQSIIFIREGLRPMPTNSTPELLKKIRDAYEFKFPIRDWRGAIWRRNTSNTGSPLIEELWKNRNKRKGKNLWGITVSDDIAHGGKKALAAYGGAASFDFITRGVVWGKSARRFVKRHEIAHGRHYIDPDTHRARSVSDLFRTARAFPHLEEAVIDPTLAREAIAQSIASAGSSRSARRFVKDFEEYGRSNLNPFGDKINMNPILDAAKAKDPSGRMGAILTQLHKNYRVDFPKQNLPLFPPQQMQ